MTAKSLMAITLLTCWLVLPLVSPAQEKVEVKTPAGWRSETIKLPPAFAQEMKWKGVEHLRFAPGMFKADADDFFTYFMLFQLDAESVTEKEIGEELVKYYTGLSKLVLRDRKPDVTAATAVFKPAKDDSKAKQDEAAKKDEEAKNPWREARLTWIEPFTTGEKQTLRLKWRAESKGKRTTLVLLASPSKDKAIWKTLQQIAESVSTGE